MVVVSLFFVYVNAVNTSNLSYSINPSLTSTREYLLMKLSDPTLDDSQKRALVADYNMHARPDQSYLDYYVSGLRESYLIGDHVEFSLVEFGQFTECWDLKVRIQDDMTGTVVYDEAINQGCLMPKESPGTFHTYPIRVTCNVNGTFDVVVTNSPAHPDVTKIGTFVCGSGTYDMRFYDDGTLPKQIVDSWNHAEVREFVKKYPDHTRTWLDKDGVMLLTYATHRYIPVGSEDQRERELSLEMKYDEPDNPKVTLRCQVDNEIDVENPPTLFSALDSNWCWPEVSQVIIPLGSGNPESMLSVQPRETTVTLDKNNVVMWINLDDVPSILVADDGSWTTGLIKPNASAVVTFNHTGTFGYHGEPHPWKMGIITVLEK